MEKLKKKFPYVYSRFQEGTADIEMLRWIMSNYDIIKEDKPKYIVIKESDLLEVKPDGTHTYK